MFGKQRAADAMAAKRTRYRRRVLYGESSFTNHIFAISCAPTKRTSQPGEGRNGDAILS